MWNHGLLPVPGLTPNFGLLTWGSAALHPRLYAVSGPRTILIIRSSMLRVPFSTLLLLLLVGFGFGQSSQPNWLTATERAKFDTLRAAGSEALFNLDYEAARKRFKEMAVSFPHYPAGPQFLADTLWAETLYQTRRLQSSLYGDDDTFYSTSNDQVDPKVVDEFRMLTRQARLLTE